MKICLFCAAKFEADHWQCPVCAKIPELIDNFFAFAPALAVENDFFPVEKYAELSKLEDNHFWFKARNQLIIWGINKYFPHANNFFEIGCGTGFVFSGIEQSLKKLKITASEIHCAGLSFAAKRATNVEFMQMDARNIPFDNEFDLIGAFDVLEHISEDNLVIEEMYKALKKGGAIFLTVPQHPFLWSQADEFACHVRRYTAKDLKTKLINAGFRIKRMTSFISFLLPIMLASRLSKQNADPLSELKINKLVNKILSNIFTAEFNLIKRGVNFPMGGSLFVIAEKKP